MQTDTEAPEVPSLNLPEVPALPPVVDLPQRLAEILEAIGSQTVYTVTVYRLDERTGSPKQLAQLRRLPDPDEVGRMFGGGDYKLHVSWRTQGRTTGRLNSREVEFSLGDNYDAEAAIARRKASPAGDDAGLEKAFSLAERMVSLSRSVGNGGQESATALAIDRILDRMDRLQERTDARFEKLAEAILDSRRQPADPFEQLRGVMAFGKEMGMALPGAQPDARPAWLEVVDIVAENAGKFLEMMTAAQKSKVAQIKLMANPQARKIATVGAAAIKDPAKRAQMIAALDAKVGPDTTNQILEALGQKRAPA